MDLWRVARLDSWALQSVVSLDSSKAELSEGSMADKLDDKKVDWRVAPMDSSKVAR